jgi:hypothetical protein
MGHLIHDRRQKPLLWQSHKTVCRRCKGAKTVYYASMRSRVEAIGGRRIPCPECGGKGTVLEPERPSLL